MDLSIQKLGDRIFRYKRHCDTEIKLPKAIKKRRSLFSTFTREVKAACHASQLGYDAITSYLISAINNQITELTEGFDQAKALDDGSFVPRHYRQVLLFLLEVGFHYFTLHPTVGSSLTLSNATVRAGQHLAEHDPEGLDVAREAVLWWTNQFARSPVVADLIERSRILPIELLNILVSLREFTDDSTATAELLDASRLSCGDGGYFKVIVQLYIYRDDNNLSGRRDDTFHSACARLMGADDLAVNAELTHMLLDLLACPFIDVTKREKLIVDVWPTLKKTHTEIGSINKALAHRIVLEIEESHWFVRWTGIGLLDMIEKKNLGTVYP